jgi:hypothetical protein
MNSGPFWEKMITKYELNRGEERCKTVYAMRWSSLNHVLYVEIVDYDDVFLSQLSAVHIVIALTSRSPFRAQAALEVKLKLWISPNNDSKDYVRVA